MKEISSMSRPELVAELISAEPLGSVVPTTLTAVEDTASSPSFDALITRKLAVAREVLLRDLAVKMKTPLTLGSPDAVRDWLKLYCAQFGHEVFLVLHLDVRNRLIATEQIFRGTLTHTSVYPREVVKSTLAHNAASVIFAHNHPSGDTAPSTADHLLTKQLISALALVDVRVADHFIVAADQVLSFAEQGLL